MRPVRHPVLLLALPAALGACGAARGGALGPGTGRAFSISSIGGQHGIQARLDGSIMMGDRWVYLNIPRGAVRTYQLDRQDYWDLRLRAGIVTCQGRDFEVVSEGRAARLAPALGLSRDAAFLDTTTRSFQDTLRLDVAVPAGIDLARSWIALIFEWPFQSVMATYTIHTNVPVDAESRPWIGRLEEYPGERCR